MNAPVVWRPRDGVLAQTLGEEVVLLDANRGVYYSLNATGAVAWRMLTEGEPVPKILAALLAEFEVAPEVLEQDLQRLLKDLEENKLIEPAGK